jgi:ATP-binding cassette subfamily F protein uup
MLDEPTNHLDIPSIQWLETFLLTQNISLLFVTHDKAFLNKVATTIVELDRGRLLRFPVPYNAYLEEKERQLEVEATERARFDKKLAEEEVWIRKGLQARRTRNMGRVRNLMQMREDHQARMHRKGNVSLNAQSTGKSGAKVFTLKNVSYQWSDQPLIKDLSLLIGRGDKVGIVGTNGCGKSTLIKLILGQLSPNQGSVEVGTRIELGYFDQLRDQLDEQKTPREVVFDGYEYADVHGKRQHVVGYLEKFLFDKNRSQTPIKVLSGGERNRLLLARMLAKPANVLILDEPTNDLDLETLEILEDVLVDFEGTVLLVSHYRDFMSNVCTNILVFQGQGVVKEYVAGLDNWEQLLPKGAKKSEAKVKEKASQELQEKPKTTVQKLSYTERKELSALPDKIDELEDKIAQVQQQLSDPEVYKQSDGQKIKELGDQVSALQSELDTMMQRWEELLARDEAS